MGVVSPKRPTRRELVQRSNFVPPPQKPQMSTTVPPPPPFRPFLQREKVEAKQLPVAALPPILDRLAASPWESLRISDILRYAMSKEYRSTIAVISELFGVSMWDAIRFLYRAMRYLEINNWRDAFHAIIEKQYSYRDSESQIMIDDPYSTDILEGNPERIEQMKAWWFTDLITNKK